MSVRRGGRWIGVLLLAASGALAGTPAAASSIEQLVSDHVERAAEGGLEPADYSHLLLAFNWRRTVPAWNVVGQGLDRLTAAGGDPLLKDEVRLLRARVAVEEGRSAAARELFHALGGLSRWWAVGPSELEELADFPERALPLTGDVTWRSVAGTDPLGWVRLSGLGWPGRRQLLYLATTVESRREQPVAVRLGAAQAARIWLNGRELLTTAWPLTRAEDQACAGAWLAAGPNLLVVAVAAGSEEAWWLRARLTAPDGSPLEGVREVEAAPRAVAGVDREVPPVRSLESAIREAVAARAPGAELALAAYLTSRHSLPEDVGEARSACRAAREQDPAAARFLEQLLESDHAVQRTLLEEALRAQPDFAWARAELARSYQERGLPEEAAGVLRQAPDEPALAATALSLDAAAWGPLVLPALQQLSRQHPRAVEVGLLLAQIALEANRLPLAREAVERLQAVVGGAEEVLRLREKLAAACGEEEVVGEVLTELLDRDPNRTDVRVRLARFRQGAGESESARSLLAEGLRRCPDHPDLLLELALLEHALGDDRRASELAGTLLALRPQEQGAQRLLTLLGKGGEEPSFRRTPEQLWQLADRAPAGSPAVVLLHHVEVHFLPGQLTEERVQRAVLVTAAKQADSFARYVIPYVPERQQLRVLAARVLRRDGSELAARQTDTPRLSEPEINIYYDTRLRMLHFGELADGDLVEVSYLLSETVEANETGPYKGGLVDLGEEVPLALAELELVGLEETLPHYELVHLTAEPERARDADGTVHLSFRFVELPPLPRDLPPAPRLLVAPHVVYSNHPGWGDLADWYGRHVSDRIRATRQVKEQADELVAGLTDRSRRIDRLYRFVTNEIRYVGLELGEHRFRPFSADWVLTHRIGDCKDKAALLVALLDAIDVPAHMALVRTADLGPVVASTAVLEYFNHVIAYLPEDSLWLDGTAVGQDPTLLPSPDQGALALVVRGGASVPESIPLGSAGVARFAFTLSPGDQGQVQLDLRIEETGDAATSRRATFGGSHDTRRWARWLQNLFPGAELIGEPVADLVPGRDPTVAVLKAVASRAALLSGGGIATYPGELDLLARLVPSIDRQTPLLVLAEPDLEWTLEVKLGRLPARLPEPVDLASSYGHLHLEIVPLELGYRVAGSLHLQPGLVPADAMPAFGSFLREVERHLRRPLEVP